MKMDIGKTRTIPVARKNQETRGRSKPVKQTAFKTIVVPVDFSETSIKALDYALVLAKEFGSHIRVIHVLEFPAVFNSTSKPSYARWDNQAKKIAAERLAELLAKKGDRQTRVDSEVRFGRAFKSICDAARQWKADLIVIGTHGFTGLKHVLLGSTAERVVRHAPCSVLTIRSQHARKPGSILKLKKILVPTDFSEAGEAAFQTATALASQYQARIHLLHVVPVHYAVGEYEQIDYQMLEAELMETGRERLKALSNGLLTEGIRVKTEIRRGRPALQITEAAEDIGADLLVISTHGLTGWRRAFLGSTTEEVIRHSTFPVLIVRTK